MWNHRRNQQPAYTTQGWISNDRTYLFQAVDPPYLDLSAEGFIRILDWKHHGQPGEDDGTNRPQVRLQVAEAAGAQVKEHMLKVKKSMEKGNVDGTCIYAICS
jgi:hypothetical protein